MLAIVPQIIWLYKDFRKPLSRVLVFCAGILSICVSSVEELS